MFTRMDQGTKADWDHIGQEHMPHIKDMPNRIYGMLEALEGVSLGFAADQLHHCLQTATMARRANASDEMVLLSLLHDIGKTISVIGHGPICAEIIKAYVSDDAYHIIRTHQDFQGEHYYHYQGKARDMRLQFKDEPWYAKAEQFTDEWDQAAFDPAYEVDSLESFKPLIDQFFSVPGKMAKAA